MNIFIGENESKDEVFEQLTQKLDIKKFKNEFSDIFKKANNNWVGYCLFEDEDEYYKIFVLPKHIKKPKDNSEDTNVIKKFIEYIKVHYQLKVKYDQYDTSSLGLKSNFELSFDSKNEDSSAQDIEEFIFYKYQSLLKEILKFFDTHKADKRVKIPYISQTVKYNLNLAKNIKEPNKTKIHQDKLEDVVFSQIATITFGVIKLFNKSKLHLIKNEDAQNSLQQLSFRIKNILQQKYQVEKGFDLTINKLLSSRNFKYFRKKKDSLTLYYNLLTLFGVEHFYDEKENKQINQSIISEAFFIRPEDLYEWIVYDRLKTKYGDEYEVLKHKLDKDIMKKYKINDTDVTSNPDIIMKKREDNSLYVIDAKWKLLNKSIPDISDILKLKRDTEVRSFDAKEIFSLLIFPKSDNLLYNEYLINSKDESTFKFYSRQIGMSDEDIDILTDITEVSLVNGNLNKLNQLIFQTNKTDYTNNPEFIEQITEEISSYVTEYFSEDTIFGNYSIIKNFIDNEHDKSETMIRLLKSSVSVLFYLDNFVDEQYSDYTLPASSIWKAIESEIKENISSLIKNIRKNNSSEKLYKDSITLGTYSFVFRNIVNYKNFSDSRNITYNTFKDILNVLDKTMEEYKSFFEIITDMRNDYTHNEIMTKGNFYECVLDGIFSTNTCTAVTIEDILKFNIEMKKNLEIL
ncbi:MAG: hypothetical protein AB7U51_05420 [Arcobacter sp.]|uniref:hypothetical protein n=1 Tax=Arcobacter sp. TaxID=1872629 RepID=UPI003D082B27